MSSTAHCQLPDFIGQDFAASALTDIWGGIILCCGELSCELHDLGNIYSFYTLVPVTLSTRAVPTELSANIAISPLVDKPCPPPSLENHRETCKWIPIMKWEGGDGPKWSSATERKTPSTKKNKENRRWQLKSSLEISLSEYLPISNSD